MLKQNLITESVLHEIEQWLKKYPSDQKQSAVLPALRLVQQQNDGWLTEALIEAVADYLQIPKIAAYEVATFYSMYNLKPVGRHKITVCNNITCMLRGSEEIIHHLQKKFAVPMGEPTTDGLFTLKEVECLGACGGAPVLQVDDRDYHDNMTCEKVDALLAELSKQGDANG
jgi:NADH-quinone oxidoreductase subunit E